MIRLFAFQKVVEIVRFLTLTSSGIILKRKCDIDMQIGSRSSVEVNEGSVTKPLSEYKWNTNEVLHLCTFSSI